MDFEKKEVACVTSGPRQEMLCVRPPALFLAVVTEEAAGQAFCEPGSWIIMEQSSAGPCEIYNMCEDPLLG